MNVNASGSRIRSGPSRMLGGQWVDRSSVTLAASPFASCSSSEALAAKDFCLTLPFGN